MALAAALLGVCALADSAAAQAYPSRPIRLVVGFAAGGTTDFMARLLADKLRDPLRQPVLVENRTGANGALGAEYVAKSDPDGYTLYFTTAGVAAVYPHLRANPPYDPIRDFVAVSLVAFNSTMLVVNAAMPANSAVELAALARQNPGRITIAITGLGSVSHLGVELFQSAAGIKFQEVPYRGNAPAMTDLLGGQLDGLFGDGPTVMPHIAAGKIKVLAAISRRRSDVFPDVPTFAEQGFADAVADQWAGVLAPAQTPAATVAKLNAAIHTALSDPEVRAKLAQTGVTPAPDSPEEFTQYLKDEYSRWGRIIRDKGIRVE
ncbi:MAG TPA: tripartite tricarboxylate transporter substrate binding protein [Xanthobacteraceae bacterium]|nr:tripartite tricarboxylate transporter substrate binding protein [Xanthobacteraceae bacterium]